MKLPYRLLPLAMLLWIGCKDEQTKQIEELQRQVYELSKSAAKIDFKAPVDEYKRLFRVEYGVFSFPADSPPEELTKQLNKLGEERWDCFFVERTAAPSAAETPALRMFCKRPPESVFRYLPSGLAGGVLNLFH